MRAKNDERKQLKYKKASSALECLFVAVFILNLLLKRFDFWDSTLYMTVIALIFAAVSGYVACLHSKLPKNQREKPNWISASDFSTHPYFTCFLFCVFSMIGLFCCFNRLP